MSGPADEDLAAVIELERRLLDPAVRLDRAALLALLHEEFTEFGASGRTYDRAAIIETLSAGDGAAAAAGDIRAVRLGPDAVLLTYRTDGPSLRTSICSRERDGSWRLRHHQETRARTGHPPVGGCPPATPSGT